jgi:DNA-directed RNA polymerase specialized sigma24 family protein
MNICKSDEYSLNLHSIAPENILMNRSEETGCILDATVGGMSHDEVYRIIHEDCWHSLRSFITTNSGTISDVEDVAHDTFMVISTGMPKDRIKSICSMPAFVIGISRKLWYDELKRRQLNVQAPSDHFIEPASDEIENQLRRQQRYSLYWQQFKNLNATCRKIIASMMKKLTSSRIREKLGMSEDYYYKRKSLCMKALLQQIKKDPRYHQLTQN